MKRVQNWRDYLEDNDSSWKEKINRKRKNRKQEYDQDDIPRDSKRKQKRK